MHRRQKNSFLNFPFQQKKESFNQVFLKSWDEQSSSLQTFICHTKLLKIKKEFAGDFFPVRYRPGLVTNLYVIDKSRCI